MDETIYVRQMPISKEKPFYLEFKQLKAYYNFQRKFKADKKDKSKQGKTFQKEYFLIDKNWLNEWKQVVGYQKFYNIKLNRDLKEDDTDYNLFKSCLPQNINELKIAPLDNSNVYNQKGDINPFAEFVIINKECLKLFGESRQNLKVKVLEKACPLIFLDDKIILFINKYTRLICYRDEKTKKDMEIIIIFKTESNIDKILEDIKKSKIKDWLEKRKFFSDGPDELEIEEKKCKIQLINKNLKLIMLKHFNRVSIKSKTTKMLKYDLPENLKDKIQYQAQEIIKNTNPKAWNNSNKKNTSIEKKPQNQNFNQFNQIQNNNNGNNVFNNMNQNNLNNNMNNMNNMNNLNNFNNCNNCNNNNFMNINMNMNNMNSMNNINMNNMNINMNNMNMNNMNMMGMNNMNNNNFGFNNMPQNNMMNPGMLDLNKNSNSSPNLPANRGNMFNNQIQNPASVPNPSSKKESIFTMGIIFPHQAGLLNIGQSCYMNATIECLSNIRSLSFNILSKFGTFDREKQPLCLAYSNLIYKLLHTREKYITPNVFKEVIGNLNPLFEGNHAADAKDLIFFIIETLHRELIPPSMNNNNFEIDFFQQELNSQNEEIVLQNFLKEFSANQTLVSNAFYGTIRTKMHCNGCIKDKFSFQTFNLLIFPLKKVKDYKMAKPGINKNNLDLNLYDAFECEQQIEKLQGENLIYCNTCRKLTEGTHKQDYYTFPPILIIILNRGRNNKDFNESFRFDQTLDFTNIAKNQNSIKKYFLCGIITHLGKSGSDGHFIAYCRNNVNENFYCYNDASVSPCSVQDAMSAKISEKETEKKTPYILLYHYMK